MSRNNSVSTATSATASTSLTSAQTSFSSILSSDHIISDFNPTLILHIPPHGAFKKPRTDIDIHDITPWLPGYNHHTLTIPDSLGVGDIKAIVSGRRWSESDVGGRGEKGAGIGGIVGSTLVSRRHSRWSSRSTVQALEERQYSDSAEWRVPWDIMKPSTIIIKSAGGERETRIDVWCGKQDHRAQLWAMEGDVRYVWRWAKDESGKEELVLEKEGGGMDSHRVGVFLFEIKLEFEWFDLNLWSDQRKLKPPISHNLFTPSSGTLILDERGLSRLVAVTSILIFLKRDRQRRSFGGRT